MSKCQLAMCVAGLFAAGAVRGADSGPAAGTDVPALPVYGVTGDVQSATVDYAAQRGARPTLYCFIPKEKWSRPTARLLIRLDEQLGGAAAEGAVVAVWVTDDPAASRDYLPRAQQSLQLSRTALTVYEANASGPGEWGINTDVDLTVVAAREGRVLKSFALVSPNDTLVDEVLAVFK